MPEKTLAPVAVSDSDLNWVRLTEDAEICEGFRSGSDYPMPNLAAGFVRCNAGFRFSWEIPHDEVIYVAEGRLEVSSPAGKVTVAAGEFIYLQEGNEMEYFFEEDSKALWVCYPTSKVISAMKEINVRS